jgi:hypothetical protein
MEYIRWKCARKGLAGDWIRETHVDCSLEITGPLSLNDSRKMRRLIHSTPAIRLLPCWSATSFHRNQWWLDIIRWSTWTMCALTTQKFKRFYGETKVNQTPSSIRFTGYHSQLLLSLRRYQNLASRVSWDDVRKISIERDRDFGLSFWRGIIWGILRVKEATRAHDCYQWRVHLTL